MHRSHDCARGQRRTLSRSSVPTTGFCTSVVVPSGWCRKRWSKKAARPRSLARSVFSKLCTGSCDSVCVVPWKNKSTSALQRSTSPTENFDFPAISFFTSSHGACCGLCCAVLNRIAKPRRGLEPCFVSLLRSPGYCFLALATDSLDQALLRPPRLSSCLQRGVV